MPVTSADGAGPVLSHMLERLEEPHPIGDLARRAAMSPRTFARRFVADTGTTPHQWLTEQRVIRAREVLEESDLPVEQVAQACGYQDVGTFRRLFSRLTGERPADYREQHRLRTSRKRWGGQALA